MPLQKLPVQNLDDINQRRRARELLNQVLDHTFDDSRVQTPAEIAAGVTPINKAYPPGDVRRYGAKGDGVNDDTMAIQDACDQAIAGGSPVLVESIGSGFYRCTSTISLSAGCRIDGNGAIISYGCDGIELAAGGSNLRINGITWMSRSSGGSADPKTHDAIVCSGTNSVPTRCNYVFLDGLYLQGWNRCVNWEYTWNSCIDNITTINCEVGVRSFGQSCNNSISKSRLYANTGTASVQIEGDGGIRSEGLMIDTSLLASGDYGIQVDQFGILSLTVVNCVIDQIADIGIDLVNAQKSSVSNTWISAANKGIHWHPVASPSVMAATVSGCHITTSASNSLPLHIEYDNDGIEIVGGSLTCSASGTSRCLVIDVINDHISMVGTHLVNPSSNASILAGSAGFRHAALTGNVTITYSAPDSYTGTLTQCTTAPTASVVYSLSGDLVTIRVPSLKATSANTTQPRITGMPTALRPSSIQAVQGFVLDNSVEAISKVLVHTNGDLILYTGLSSTFTAANDKGTDGMTFTYRRF